jgi:hypothetical protein
MKVKGMVYTNPEGEYVGPYTDWGGYCKVPLVNIDLRPNNKANQVNLTDSKLFPVAILATEEWNPCDTAAGVKEDTVEAFDAKKSVRSTCRDVNMDGITDMVLSFRPSDLTVDCSAAEKFVLTGETIDKVPFEGSDSVKWLGCM